MDVIGKDGEFHESKDLSLELEAGQLVDNRYEVISKLGSGATASVYKCQDRLLGNLEVAIKVFKYNKHLTDEVITRLSREIWASFGINHANVARFYECIRNENMLGLVMEYIDGQTLEDFLHERERLEPGQVKYVLEKVCAGVAAMHAQGVLHRDLKPANIMVSKNGDIIITDLGLAKNAPMISVAEDMNDSASKHIYSELARESNDHTSKGDVVGTPLYLAPEYLMQGRADISCDVYALGIIAYELITGEAPFDGEPLYQFLIRKVKEDPPEPYKIRSACPKNLSKIIMRAISRDPKKRFKSAKELSKTVEMLKLSSVPVIMNRDDEWEAVYAKDEVDKGPGLIARFLQVSGIFYKCAKALFAFTLALACAFALLVILYGPSTITSILQGDFSTAMKTVEMMFRR